MVKFSELIRKDREERKKQDFEGTFLDYLAILKDNPPLCMLAHQRMYEVIKNQGAANPVPLKLDKKQDL